MKPIVREMFGISGGLMRYVMEHWRNDTVKRKSKYSEENLLKLQFVHNKPQVDWPGIEPQDLH
jgi:hypothetical protein